MNFGPFPLQVRACRLLLISLSNCIFPSYIQVIMGGGRQCLKTEIVDSDADPIDTWSCRRKDGKDLMKTWTADKVERRLHHKVVENTGSLLSEDTQQADFVLGTMLTILLNN